MNTVGVFPRSQISVMQCLTLTRSSGCTMKLGSKSVNWSDCWIGMIQFASQRGMLRMVMTNRVMTTRVRNSKKIKHGIPHCQSIAAGGSKHA